MTFLSSYKDTEDIYTRKFNRIPVLVDFLTCRRAVSENKLLRKRVQGS
jgi:hypothetical protein